MNDAILAFCVLSAMLAVSDIIAAKTKASIDSMLTFSVLLCVAFWLGMPYSIIDNAYIIPLASLAQGLVLTHMGSSITLDQFKKEWKTACIGFVQVAMMCVIVYFFGQFVVGKVYAYAGGPIMAGGFVAYLILAEPLTKAGMQTAASFCLLLMTAQSLIGIPLASFIIKKDAKRFIASGEVEKYQYHAENTEVVQSKFQIIPPLPDKYNKQSVIFTKALLVTGLGSVISTATGGKLNFALCCLLLGIFFTQIGFLDKDVLTKANVYGVMILILNAYIFEGVYLITPEIFISLLKPFLLIMIIGMIAIAIGGFVCSKLFKTSFEMAAAIGLAALFGFPATYYIAVEVAEGYGSDEQTRNALENYLVPRMLIAGFATVTIGSVVAASIMLPGLLNMI